MKDTTLTELLDLMKAYADKLGFSPSILILEFFGLKGGGRLSLSSVKTLFYFSSLPDLIEKLKK